MPAPKRQQSRTPLLRQTHDIGDWRMSRMKYGIQFMSLFPPFSSPSSAGARADVREQRGRVHSPLRAAVRYDPQLHPHQALMQHTNAEKSIYDARSLYRTYEHQLCLPTREGFSLSKRFPEIYLRAPHGMVAAMWSCLGEIC